MSAQILTGYTGTRHITPLDDAAVYRSIIGQDSYITSEGNLCEGTMPSINQFNVASGQLSIQGVQVRVTAETLSVDTCATGYVRTDLVVARWTHDQGTLIDSVELAVLKGPEVLSGNTPTPPTINTGSIDQGATAVDMVLYRIDLAGSTVTFTQIAEVANRSIDTLGTLVLEVASFSTLPQTVTDDRISDDMVVINSALGNPSAQTGDWTVTTSDGSLVISGTISGTTSLTLYLNKSR